MPETNGGLNPEPQAANPEPIHTMEAREPEDPDFSAPPVPAPPATPAPADKPAKGAGKRAKKKDAVEPADEADGESSETASNQAAEPADAEDGKPKAGERGHPLVGDAEPIAPTPSIGANELADISAAQRAKKHGIRLKKALKEFPEIQDIIDENEALKALVAELKK
jgi:hypothetical protein